MKGKKGKTVLFLLCIILIAFGLYSLAFAVFPYYFPPKNRKEYKILSSLGEKDTSDRAGLIADPVEAGRIRLKLIREAKGQIDVVIHLVESGEYTSLFMASLIEAADRGVKVRFMCDGLLGFSSGSELRSYRKALSGHPNITFAEYEPFKLFVPWSWNNRLHDKFLLVDNKVLVTGGRNLADKEFVTHEDRINPVYDLDVIITSDDYAHSVIRDTKNYIDSLFSYKHVAFYKNKEVKGKKERERLLSLLDKTNDTNRYLDFSKINLDEMTTDVTSISMVSNPQGRWSKKSIIWDNLYPLYLNAKDTVNIQSPYFVLTNEISDELNNVNKNGISINYITNSALSTPNYPAFSAYLRCRKNLERSGNIYEYVEEGSVHSKSATIDDNISVVGSFNMDPRSMYIDTETMFVIEGKEFNFRLSEYQNTIKAASQLRNQKTSEAAVPVEKEPSLVKTVLLWFMAVISWPFKMLV